MVSQALKNNYMWKFYIMLDGLQTLKYMCKSSRGHPLYNITFQRISANLTRGLSISEGGGLNPPINTSPVATPLHYQRPVAYWGGGHLVMAKQSFFDIVQKLEILIYPLVLA